MKRSFCLFVIILSIISSKGQEIIYSKDLPNESDLAIIKIHLGKDTNLITFVSKFKSENVSIFIDSILIFNKKISTNPNLGAAKGVKFSREAKHLHLIMNDKKEINIGNSSDYRFIYLFKTENKYRIEYKKKPFKFY